MSTYGDLVDTMRIVGERTGDPKAWQSGLTPDEVVAVVTPTTGTEQLQAILSKIRQRHANLFAPPVAPDAPASGRAEGEAARAIADAETALAHQNSTSSQLDLQVISAILNAHLTNVAGGEALNKLQREIEAGLRMRSDLDTPAGARDFQRFLIGKLRDIREVVATASLDDTSKSALMAAWTSLYNASKNAPEPTADRPGKPPPAATHGSGQRPASAPDAAADPLLDSLLLDDPGLLAAAAPAQQPAAAAAPTPAASSTTPSTPGGAGAASPGGGGTPGWSAPGGNPLSGLGGTGTGRASRGLDGLFDDVDPKDRTSAHDDKDKDGHPDDPDEDERDPDHDRPPGEPESPPVGPTTVTLPNGDTVTAASPQLAAAIKAAAGGTPIADAFQQQGMSLPPPGTAVTSPIDPVRVTPGDIGMFTDRHALALGRSKALLDGQIQQISTVSGPSFLGWEHPPMPAAPALENAPARTDTPTPTRPAAMPTA